MPSPWLDVQSRSYVLEETLRMLGLPNFKLLNYIIHLLTVECK